MSGQACAVKASAGDTKSKMWFIGAGLERFGTDSLTSAAIGSAVLEAMKTHPDADSIVVTRVVIQGHGPDKVCATVAGRAVRLRKATIEPTPAQRAEQRDSDPDGLKKPD